MKLSNHFGIKYLTDPKMPRQVMEKLKQKAINRYSDATTSDLIMNEGQTAYYLCKSTISEAAKIKVKSANWRAFFGVTIPKATLLMANGVTVRVLQYATSRLAFLVLQEAGDEVHFGAFITDCETGACIHDGDTARSEDDFLSIFRIMCFMFLGQTTTFIAETGAKIKEQRLNSNKEKTINDTPINVVVVNSSWNIEYINPNSFEVSGHFRLQPYKDGHRLIYISAYSKHGYHRRAKATH